MELKVEDRTRKSLVQLCEGMLRIYEVRDVLFGTALRQDFAWTALLHLAVAKDGLKLSELAARHDQPGRTMARWLGLMLDRDMVTASGAPSDLLYALTPATEERLLRVLRAAWGQGIYLI